MPWAVQMNPCPPQCPSPPQLRRAAEDHPLPLSCGPAPRRLKWRRPPCPSTAAASAWPYPAAQGLRGERAPVGAGARPLPPQPGRREAGCPAGAALAPCSALRGGGGSPLLAALLCPVLSAFPPPGPTGDGWETRGARFLCGKRDDTQRGGGVAPSSPRGARAGVSRRHGRSSGGLPPRCSLGAFLRIRGFTIE